LQRREAGRKRRFDELLQQGFAAASQRRFTEEDAAAGTHANWMDPSPPRLHPVQRAAAATAATAGAVTSQRAQQHLLHVNEPAVDDTEDPLTRGLEPPAEDDAAWVAAYRRASDKRLPRPLRVLGWQILHAAVYVGGERVFAARNRQELLGCCCRQPQCWPQPQADQPQHQQQPGGQPQPLQPGNHPQQLQQQQQQAGAAGEGGPPPPPVVYQLESLSHLFVGCPTIREAWQWLEGVWNRVQPGAGVDCSDVRVVLLDDGSVWQPPVELRPLWTHLRLLMLESVWVVRNDSGGRPYSSGQVVSRFLAVLQQQLQQDWARTLGDIRLNSGVPLSWLRGRSPVMSSARFEAKWQAEGVLYTAGDGEGVRLCLPPLGG
jgi:hypothetical protein